jgi:pullulanase
MIDNNSHKFAKFTLIASFILGVVFFVQISNNHNNQTAQASGSGTNRVWMKNSITSTWDEDDAGTAVHYWGGAQGTYWPGERVKWDEANQLVYYDLPADVTDYLFVRVSESNPITDRGAKTEDLTYTDSVGKYFDLTGPIAWGGATTPGSYVSFIPQTTTIVANFAASIATAELACSYSAALNAIETFNEMATFERIQYSALNVGGGVTGLQRLQYLRARYNISTELVGIEVGHHYVYQSAFVTMKNVKVVTALAPHKIEIIVDGQVLKASTNFDSGTSYITLDEEFDWNTNYSAKVYFSSDPDDYSLEAISKNEIYDSQEFYDAYHYEGDDLGVAYTPTSSTFKVWAPTSSNMHLRIYDNGTPLSVSPSQGSNSYTSHQMNKLSNGVWTTTLNGNYHGKYYTYYVTNHTGQHEVVDPYAKATGVNGLRGMIVNFDLTDPTGWDEVELNTINGPTELSIYELHVRDLTMDSTWTGTESKRGRFAGLHESGTTYTSGGTTVSTGFDHIVELGVNAVHLLPFFHNDNDEINPVFDWGYNPVNYNVVHGGYASDPFNGLVRITELKEMIQAYADEDIRIIMDVVYNHVSDAGTSNFQRLVPNYYFRFKPDGSYSEGSGCGNDTASERSMFSKFMIDSVAWWAQEYKLGGFRYDLMGLHDVDTMNESLDKLRTIRSDIVVYGEPWHLDTHTTKPNVQLATQSNLNLIPEIGAFNDRARDGIKGSSFNLSGQGWIQNSSSSSERDNILHATRGRLDSSINNPIQQVTYVSCHDNYTLYDKLLGSGVSSDNAPRVSTQATSMVFTSQGIPFMHAGEELMRQKLNPNGTPNSNSYNASDQVNSLKWDRKITYFDWVQRHRELIEMRNNHAIFHYKTASQVNANYTQLSSLGNTSLSSSAIAYKLTRGSGVSDTYREVIVLHNGNASTLNINLGASYYVGFISDGSYALNSLRSSISVGRNRTIVLYLI